MVTRRYAVRLLLLPTLLLVAALPILGCGGGDFVRYRPGDGRADRTAGHSGFYELHVRTDDRRVAEWNGVNVYVAQGESIGFEQEDGVIRAFYGPRSQTLEGLPANTRYVSWRRERSSEGGGFGDAMSNVAITIASVALIVGAVGLLILVAGSDGEAFDGR